MITGEHPTHRRHVGPDCDSSAAREPDDLVEALLDLHGIKQEAHEEGDEGPTEETIRCAEGVLRSLYNRIRQPYGVYGMTDGDIAIDVSSPPGTKLIVVCDADGSARCLEYVNDEFQSHTYDDPKEIPDRVFMDALHRVQTASVNA